MDCIDQYGTQEIRERGKVIQKQAQGLSKMLYKLSCIGKFTARLGSAKLVSYHDSTS
jgi:hypothetical protein